MIFKKEQRMHRERTVSSGAVYTEAETQAEWPWNALSIRLHEIRRKFGNG